MSFFKNIIFCLLDLLFSVFMYSYRGIFGRFYKKNNVVGSQRQVAKARVSEQVK